VDAGLIWTAAGTVVALVVGGWQLRLQILDRRDRKHARADVSVRGVSVAPPTGRLPSVRGRHELLQQLRHFLRKPDGRVQVLAGMGGVGKSTVALALADYAGRRGWRGPRLMWWVSAGKRRASPPRRTGPSSTKSTADQLRTKLSQVGTGSVTHEKLLTEGELWGAWSWHR
jgi:Mrp family chromosome partitioning ATPase